MTRGLPAVFAGLALAAALGVATSLWPSASPVQQALLGTEAACGAYSGLPPGWGTDPHAGMVLLHGGRFTLGADDGYPEEKPKREARVGAFWIDRTEVTNAQFAAFVVATGYVTEAQREHRRGIVFRAPFVGDTVAYGSWWRELEGADWRHPDGPESDLKEWAHHPVVQVTCADAQAYAHWLGRRLPTEVEWEFAAKAGGAPERIERGPRGLDGTPAANFWQGQFPYLDTGEDGHVGLAPVGCYPANGFGLHDMIGNAWEWTADPWSGPFQFHGTEEPRGRAASQGLIKGGSFLCATDFCVRYRASARHPQEIDLPTIHVGFRTVRDVP